MKSKDGGSAGCGKGASRFLATARRGAGGVVAAGLSPAVEPGFQPGGLSLSSHRARVTQPTPRSTPAPFRAAGYRPLRQPGWLPLHTPAGLRCPTLQETEMRPCGKGRASVDCTGDGGRRFPPHPGPPCLATANDSVGKGERSCPVYHRRHLADGSHSSRAESNDESDCAAGWSARRRPEHARRARSPNRTESLRLRISVSGLHWILELGR
jgi:hypothetical protein